MPLLLSLLITLVALLVVVGVLLWIVQSAPFIDAELKPIIRWAILAIVALYLLALFLGLVPLPAMPLAR